MKTVKGSPIFNFYFLFILVINIIVYIKYEFTFFELVFVLGIVDIFYIFLAKYGFHYFQYDEEKIIIRNSWNFLFYDEIKMSSIKEIYLSPTFGGIALIVVFNEKKKSFGVNNISNKNLEDMVKDMRSMLEKEDRIK